MRTIYILLAGHTRLHRDLLTSLLRRERSLEIVAAVDGEVSLATVLAVFLNGPCDIEAPVIAILSIADTERTPPEVSRLLIEFPELTIIGICWLTGDVRSFQLKIEIAQASSSLTGLMDAIRDCASHSRFF